MQLAKENSLSALEEAINDAKKQCDEAGANECASAWDTVEELSAAIAHKKAQVHSPQRHHLLTLLGTRAVTPGYTDMACSSNAVHGECSRLPGCKVQVCSRQRLAENTGSEAECLALRVLNL